MDNSIHCKDPYFSPSSCAEKASDLLLFLLEMFYRHKAIQNREAGTTLSHFLQSEVCILFGPHLMYSSPGFQGES